MFGIIWVESKQRYIVQRLSALTLEERINLIGIYPFEKEAWKAVKSLRKKDRHSHSVMLKDVVVEVK